jgi:hypothetical protein
MIVATQMTDDWYSSFAAKVAADYTLTDGGVTYGDWYLPSIHELNLLHTSNAFPLTNAWYWSSTEASVSEAKIKSLWFGGDQVDSDKGSIGRVRAIRSF